MNIKKLTIAGRLDSLYVKHCPMIQLRKNK